MRTEKERQKQTRKRNGKEKREKLRYAPRTALGNYAIRWHLDYAHQYTTGGRVHGPARAERRAGEDCDADWDWDAPALRLDVLTTTNGGSKNEDRRRKNERGPGRPTDAIAPVRARVLGVPADDIEGGEQQGEEHGERNDDVACSGGDGDVRQPQNSDNGSVGWGCTSTPERAGGHGDEGQPVDGEGREGCAQAGRAVIDKDKAHAVQFNVNSPPRLPRRRIRVLPQFAKDKLLEDRDRHAVRRVWS
ncbi:hypothetical protein B0H13DRAFT_1876287 [Mycena leptocephala]|nr:hypothetical protein B0H13DRAFT_1876287 [Mycena leptocephala]